MDDEVINDLFARAQGLGYKKERQDFLSLLATDSEVFGDNFTYVQQQGYKKNSDAFAELLGIKKKFQPQVAPSVSVSDGKETSAASPFISEGEPTSLDLQGLNLEGLFQKHDSLEQAWTQADREAFELLQSIGETTPSKSQVQELDSLAATRDRAFSQYQTVAEKIVSNQDISTEPLPTDKFAAVNAEESIPGALGRAVRSVPLGGVIDDMYGMAEAGGLVGASGDEIFMSVFGEATEERAQDLYENMVREINLPVPEGVIDFQRKMDAAESIENLPLRRASQLYIALTDLPNMLGTLSQSYATLARGALTETGFAAGSAGGAAAAPLGLVGGPLAELTVPVAAARGFFGGLAANADVTAESYAFLKEEIADRLGVEVLTEKNLSPEIILETLKDEKVQDGIMAIAMGRGLPTYVISAASFGVIKSVSQRAGAKGILAKKVQKVAGDRAARVTQRQVAARVPMVATETGLAVTQEATAQIGEQLVRTGGVEGFEGRAIVEEASPEIIISALTGTRRYSVNGKFHTAEEIKSFAENATDETLVSSEINIKNDQALSKEVSAKVEASKARVAKEKIKQSVPDGANEAQVNAIVNLETRRAEILADTEVSKTLIRKIELEQIDNEIRKVSDQIQSRADQLSKQSDPSPVETPPETEPTAPSQQMTLESLSQKPEVITVLNREGKEPIEGVVKLHDVEKETLVFESATEIIDLGNVDEVKGMMNDEFGISFEVSDVVARPDGKVEVAGDVFELQSDLPTRGVEVDEDGNVTRVSLRRTVEEGGVEVAPETQMFEGAQAEEIAYQINRYEALTDEQKVEIAQAAFDDEELTRQGQIEKRRSKPKRKPQPEDPAVTPEEGVPEVRAEVPESEGIDLESKLNLSEPLPPPSIEEQPSVMVLEGREPVSKPLRLAQYVQKRFQSKFADFYRLQEQVRKKQGKLDQDQDFILAQELMEGKAHKELNELEGLADELVAIGTQNKLSFDAIQQFAYAKTAQEANEQTARRQQEELDKLEKKKSLTAAEKKRISKLQEDVKSQSGSGITTEEANFILDSYRNSAKAEAMEQAHKKVMEIAAFGRKIQEKSGLKSADEISQFESDRPNYVPLKGFGMEEKGDKPAPKKQKRRESKKRYDTRGAEGTSRAGRRTLAADPVAQLLHDVSEKVIRGRKNIALQSLYRFVQENPAVDAKGNLLYQVLTPSEIRAADFESLNSDQKREREDRRVRVKFDGKEHVIEFNDPAYANTLKGLDEEELGRVGKFLQVPNNWLRRSFTTADPGFIFRNFARDLPTAIINAAADADLLDSPIYQKPEVALRMITRVPDAIRGLLRENFTDTKDPTLGKYFDEAVEDGVYISSWGKYTASLQANKEKIEGALNLKEHTFADKVTRSPGKIASGFLGFIENINEAFELGVRYSAYVEAREAGVSRDKAAQFAKNITVNFSKKGEVSKTVNAWTLFFNASVQGTARFARAMKSPTGRIILGDIFVFSIMLDMLNRGMSDQEGDDLWYDKISPDEKMRNIIIMTGGSTYTKIPVPFAYGLSSNFGTVFSEVFHGKKTIPEALLFMGSATANALNPFSFGNSDRAVVNATRQAIPTALTFAFDMLVNETYFGNEVFRDQPVFGPEVPESELSKRSPEFLDEIAKKINKSKISGGSEQVPGKLDFNPDMVWYPLDYAAGGTGRFFLRSAELIQKISEDAPVKRKDIPIFRSFFGDAKEGAFYVDFDEYSENRNTALQLIAERSARPASQRETKEAKQRYRGLGQIARDLRRTEKKNKDLRDELKEAREIQDYTKRLIKVDQLREEQRLLYVKFNEIFDNERKEKD